MKIFNKKNIFLEDAGLQDVLFLGGIFIFVSIIIIAFFPDRDSQSIVSQNFLAYIMMLVPVIAAIYFIIVSFRRNLYAESAEISSSIRKKITIAFVFVSVLPSLPIVLVSNYLLNKTVSNLNFTKVYHAYDEALAMSRESVNRLYPDMKGELEAIEFFSGKVGLPVAGQKYRDFLREAARVKKMSALFFKINRTGAGNKLEQLDGVENDFTAVLRRFLEISELNQKYRIDRISIKNSDYIIGTLALKDQVIVMYRAVPEYIERRMSLFSESIEDYRKLEFLTTFFKQDAEVFLLSLSFVIIIIAVLVSLYLSKSITKPVLELSEAARQVAVGNFNVKINRTSEDELGLLFDSFNMMVHELDQNRKLMYQKQRLEAWREMARKVVHEIKNPLTPIRLSAERMRRRFIEKHADIDTIILTGTETIIEEVDVLMNILSEFTKFARLPEMNPVKININPILENCMIFFSGNEKITFDLDVDESMPGVYVDKILLWQALTNLIQNAVDAMKGMGTIRISSRYITVNGVQIVRISIEDNGAGIKPEDLEHIFEPGYSTKPSGTGLGLAIVEKIILEHNGRVYCQSKPGEGTTFIIDLPADTSKELENGKNFNR